jgi:hypothetical protein
MPPFFIALALIFAVHVALCGWVTQQLLTSPFYEREQKTVWFIPVIGAVLVWMFLKPDHPNKPAESGVDDDDVEESVFSDKSETSSASAAGADGD